MCTSAGGVTSLVSAGEINGDGATAASSTAPRTTAAAFSSIPGGAHRGHTYVLTISTSARGEPRHSYRRARSTATKRNRYLKGASADGARVFFRPPNSSSPSDTDDRDDVYRRSGGQTTSTRRARSTANWRLPRLPGRLGRRQSRLLLDRRAARCRRHRRSIRHLRALRGTYDAGLAGPDQRQPSVHVVLPGRVGRRHPRLL